MGPTMNIKCKVQMRGRGESAGSQSRTCSKRNTLKRCKNNGVADNIVLIDVDSDNIDDVIIIDVPESLKQKLRGSSVLRKEKKFQFGIVIRIDDDLSSDDESSDNKHPGTNVEGVDNFTWYQSSNSMRYNCLNMPKVQNELLRVETTCGSLLCVLQTIWDEVGELDAERDKMLLEIERECLEVYRRKVDQANCCRAQLRQAIADSEAELAVICSTLGERPVHIRQSDQIPRSLKEQIRAILQQLEEMQKRKCSRRNQFLEVLNQIQEISNELRMPSEYTSSSTVMDETDLSLRKLEELHRELQALQKEKSDRLKQVLNLLNTLNSLCLVLGMDFKQTANEVHPSLGNDSERTKNISNDIIEQLGTAIHRLREVKRQRMQQLQDLATSMLQLWNLMDTPIEEQQMFQNVTCNIAASEHEITEPNMLSMNFINSVEAEVSRLEELKESKMKEIVLKKRLELEEISRKTHLIPESDNGVELAMEALESGDVDPSCVLEQLELLVSKVKEEAFSRKEILEKVEKWLAACEEECWLEEYNMDENRYNAGRGAHLTLKRAEKARALVNKLPGMMEVLASKITSWERERGIEFTYDGIRLLSMLEKYTILRQEREQERKRQRDEKKLQEQLMAEQETLFGSKPSPVKLQNAKKGSRSLSGSNGTMLQSPNTRQAKRSDAFAAVSAGNGREVESPMKLKRKPLSLISPTESPKSNTTNFTEDLNRNQNEISQHNETQVTTPSKVISAAEEEFGTPKAMPIPMPATPSTVLVPMQTATTPAPPSVTWNANKVEEIPEGTVEYSFEEQRAGFVLPKTHLKS